MIEHILRRFLEHPSRRLIVVIGTFVIGLVAVWPAADEYLALTGERAKINSAIAQTEATLSRLDFFKKRVQQRVDELENHEAATVSLESVREFRARVVKLAREHGCQIRRINLSESQTRKWKEKDSPLDRQARGPRGKDTKFDLRSQQFKLTVIGSLSAITNLLNDLKIDDKLVYTNIFSLRPTLQDRKMAELEIELTLFDLEGDPAVSA